MKKTLLSIAFALITPVAMAAQPSDESIRELLQVTDARQLMEGAMAQTDQMIKATMEQSLQGKEVSAEYRKILEDMQTQMVAVLNEDLGWSSMEPMFVEIYQKSFTQSEVDGMLEFYQSDAGKAVTAKMPLVMQNTMMLLQQRMANMAGRMQQIENAAVEKLKANAAE